jgi:hypothetical protein
VGEIEVFRTLETGSPKWYKEHIPDKGNELTDEEISLLDDMEMWWVKQNLLWVYHNSRKKDRMNIDNSPISRSVEDVPSEYTQLSIKLLETQDHKGEKIEQVRPPQVSVDSRGKVRHGRRSSYSNVGSYPT